MLSALQVLDCRDDIVARVGGVYHLVYGLSTVHNLALFGYVKLAHPSAAFPIPKPLPASLVTIHPLLTLTIHAQTSTYVKILHVLYLL